MENLDKKECCEGKHGAMCMMGGHGCCEGRHHLVKIILKIVIIILIFWCGFRLGEITGYLRASGYGNERANYKMMRGYDYYNNSGVNDNTQDPASVQ